MKFSLTALLVVLHAGFLGSVAAQVSVGDQCETFAVQMFSGVNDVRRGGEDQRPIPVCSPTDSRAQNPRCRQCAEHFRVADNMERLFSGIRERRCIEMRTAWGMPLRLTTRGMDAAQIRFHERIDGWIGVDSRDRFRQELVRKYSGGACQLSAAPLQVGACARMAISADDVNQRVEAVSRPTLTHIRDTLASFEDAAPFNSVYCAQVRACRLEVEGELGDRAPRINESNLVFAAKKAACHCERAFAPATDGNGNPIVPALPERRIPREEFGGAVGLGKTCANYEDQTIPLDHGDVDAVGRATPVRRAGGLR